MPWPLGMIQMKTVQSSHVAQLVKNLTSMHEAARSIPGMDQWAKHPVLAPA